MHPVEDILAGRSLAEDPCRPLLERHPALLVVLSGPSGVGKDSVLNRMRALGYPLYYTVTATTRTRRPEEREGVDYHFITRDEFERIKARGDFLEWARVYGNYYGIPKVGIRRALAAGQDAIVKPDVQGAAHIRELAPEALFIFLAPPSMAELAERLRQRQTENHDAFRTRLATAFGEMEHLPRFDYVVVNKNDRLDQTVEQVWAIIRAEKCRMRPRRVEL